MRKRGGRGEEERRKGEEGKEGGREKGRRRKGRREGERGEKREID